MYYRFVSADNYPQLNAAASLKPRGTLEVIEMYAILSAAKCCGLIEA